MGGLMFRCAYSLYLTGLGRQRHNRQIAGVRESGVHPHSKFAESQQADQFLYGSIQVIPVPFLEDNLAYIVQDRTSGAYFLVDPADFDAVEEVKEVYGVTGAPEAIVTTHKHWDHAGHNQRYADAYPGIRIVYGRNEPVYAGTVPLVDDESLPGGLLGGKVTLTAFETPCHTAAHTMFILKINDDALEGVNKMIFTGDCLFEGGVGMFFEGVPEQMATNFDNLFTSRVKDGQDRCTLFFGHDYGFKNYLWAADHCFGDKDIAHIPESEILDLKQKVVARKDALLAKRRAGFANTGTLLSEEMQTNLFFIAHKQAMTETAFEKQTLLNFIKQGFQKPDPELEEEYMSPRQNAVCAIGRLRESRSVADGPCNELAAQLRTEQAGQHRPQGQPNL